MTTTSGTTPSPATTPRSARREEGARGGLGRIERRLAGPSGPAGEQYHLYCQWQMDRQLAALSGDGRPGLLFDLPLGVHPRGFDVTRWPDLFAPRVSAGAPPDAFFAGGQDWETPPLDPRADRRDGYLYFRACLRNLMRHASVLRIDHMMSFHRLFWIPEGTDPKDGAYVTYPAEELYAVLSRESHLYRTTVVGEDLGTVPKGVRASMRRHAVARTWIFLGTLRPRARTIAPDIPPGALVTLETHDMAPLAGFLHGDDIETRVETGQLDAAGARREQAERRRLVARLVRLFGGADIGGRDRASRTTSSRGSRVRSWPDLWPIWRGVPRRWSWSTSRTWCSNGDRRTYQARQAKGRTGGARWRWASRSCREPKSEARFLAAS